MRKQPYHTIVVYTLFLCFSVFLFPNTSHSAARSTPFVVGETLDPGAESVEPCGPTDANCFPSVLTAQDEGVTLTINTTNINFVGAGVTVATTSTSSITITIPGVSASSSNLGFASSTALTVSGQSYLTYASTTALTVNGNTYFGIIASGTWNGNAITDSYVADTLTVSGGTLGSNTIAGGATWTTSNGLTINGSTTLQYASTTALTVSGDTFINTLTATSALFTNATTTNATSTNLAVSGLFTLGSDQISDLTGQSGGQNPLFISNGALTIATSTFFTNSGQFASWLSDQTGTGNVVFSSSPTFTGTPTFQNLYMTTTGTSTLGHASTTALTVAGQSYFEGNVGIGTSTPDSLVDIYSAGGAQLRLDTGANAGTSQLIFKAGSGGSDFGDIFFGGSEYASYGGNNSLNVRNSSATGSIAFTTGLAVVPVLTINSSGNVGIGTTSPSRLLTIQGGDVWLGGNLTATGTLTLSALTGGVAVTNSSGVVSASSTLSASLLDALVILSSEIDSLLEIETIAGVSNILIENDLDASSELIGLIDDETGTGSLVFSTSSILESPTIHGATLTGFRSSASSTIGDGTATGGLTISGNSTTTGGAYIAGNVGIGTTTLGYAFTVQDESYFGGNMHLGTFSDEANLEIRGNGGTTNYAGYPATLGIHTVNHDNWALAIRDELMGTTSDIMLYNSGTASGGGQWDFAVGDGATEGLHHLLLLGKYATEFNYDNTQVNPIAVWNNYGTNFGSIGASIPDTWYLGYGDDETSTSTPVLAWNTSGNVGIGTTSPSRLLTIQGGDVWLGGNLTSTGTITATSFSGVLTGTSTDLSCTDCINATQIEDIYVLNSGGSISGNLTFSGAAANIALGSNFISNGGTDAGLSFDGSNGAIFSDSVTATDGYVTTAIGVLTATGASTNERSITIANTSGSGVFGVEGSAGGNIFTGATAYSTVIGSYLDDVQIISANVLALTAVGNAISLPGTLTVTGTAQFGFTSSANASTTGLTATNAYVGNRLAIGTSTPSSKLTIWGTGTGSNQLVNFVDSASTTLFTVLENGNVGIGSTSPSAMLSISQGIGGTGTLLQIASSTDGTATTTHFIVDSFGNVGIGTSTPTALLSIDAGSALVSSSTRMFSITATTTTSTHATTSEVFTVWANGYIGINNPNPTAELDVQGDFEYTGEITDTSDMRLKENIENVIDPLSIITALDAKSYNMIGSSRREYGFLAQEVQEIFPDAVKVIDSRNGYLGLNYMSFIPLLAGSIKEQQITIEQLLSASSSMTTLTEGETIWSRLAELANSFVDGVLTLAGIRTDELCVGAVCVNEATFLKIVEDAEDSDENTQSNDDDSPSAPVEDDDSVDTEGGEEDPIEETSTDEEEVIVSEDETTDEEEVIVDSESEEDIVSDEEESAGETENSEESPTEGQDSGAEAPVE